MFKNLALFSASGAMSAYASRQQAVSSGNIANADTPGYKAQRLPEFSDIYHRQRPAMARTRVAHLHGAFQGDFGARLREADTESSPNGNSVSLEEEMIHAVAAERQNTRAIAIYKHGLSLLRSTLGRR